MTRSLRCAWILRSFRNTSKFYSLRGLSDVSNLFGQFLNAFLIFLARKYMLHSDTPLIVAINTKDCSIWEKRTVSQPKIFVDFPFLATHIFSECFYSVHISQHNGNYRMISFNLVCALYWYIAVLACKWRHVSRLPSRFWEAKEVRFRTFRYMLI